ncbi:DUF2029 domain-containing protein [Corynebacterium sp. sy017]|uniref:glycosyltransferase family 87 protein n=1 Tax=unclassified Corynebacterium TaxID=2624378 RepID=UPI0011858E91|nr:MULTISPECIES: glycosyltransferase family 87 protein [unclassified Corynebacterium]MBP3088816.1 DUF2029 domain-containing protein [Corynebacterium sp. sy017]TSD91160.1 DUF2029 domain-containing protein [Corynebacterium sp. SY003]
MAAWWIAARLVDQGRSSALYAINPMDFALATGEDWQREALLISDAAALAHPYVHHPLIAYMLAPLTKIITFRAFVIIIAGINGFCFALLTASSISLWTRQATPTGVLVAGTSVLWLSTAGQLSIYLGQTSPLVFALIALSLVLSRKNPIASGVYIALAALIKVTPAIIIVVFLGFASRRKAGVSALFFSSIMIVVTYMWCGRAVMNSWLDTLSWINEKTLVSPINSSVDSLFAGTRNLTAIVQVISDTPVAVTVIKLCIALVLLGLLLLQCGSKTQHLFEICAVTALIMQHSLIRFSVAPLCACRNHSYCWHHYHSTQLGCIGGVAHTIPTIWCFLR